MLKMMSYTSAKNLGDAGLESMQVRGRMQEGMVADIAVFDWDKVTDNSDYAEGKNGLPTTGIPYVLVSGTVVVEDSKVLKGVNPGQAIRYTPTKTSLFKKLENKGDWVTKAKFPH
jgi:N-acyl-D-aspartate/D-glutamate deacylase